MTIQRLLPVLVALALFAGAPAAHGDIADVLATPYPDPQQRLTEAKGAAQFGGPQEQWVLAEALIGVHRFAESDRAFRAAASGALKGDALDLRAIGQLADRLEQRMLLEQAIQVRERRVERALADVPADGLLTRAERELAAGAMDDYKRIAELHLRLLRYDDYFAARERVLDIAPDDRRAGELASYLDELLWMERTDRALLVAQTHAELTGDVEVLRKALEVMIRERQQKEAHRMLRLAVTSSMDYWDFRYLLVEYMEVFDPGVRWAADRDERLRALLVSRPPQAIDHLLLGSAYQVVGDTELEEQAYRSYLNTGGVTAPKLRTAGDLLYGMGKTAEAFLLYQRFLAEHPEHDLEPAVLLRVVDCLERTYDLQASFHGAFNAFGYLFLDERTPQVPVGIFSVLYNDVPLQTRMDGLEDALDRYYVDLLAVDLLWNMVERHPDAVETDRAFHDLLSYYQRYKDTDRQLEVCELYIQRYAHRPEANEFRFEEAAIHHQLGHYASEEAAYRAAYDATLPPPGTPRPYEPVDPDELTRTQQHDRAFRSLLSYYDRDRVARFYDAVALYKAEIDVRGGDLALVDELVRLCDQQSAYDEIEQLYEEVIATYDTMAVYDKLARRVAPGLLHRRQALRPGRGGRARRDGDVPRGPAVVLRAGIAVVHRGGQVGPLRGLRRGAADLPPHLALHRRAVPLPRQGRGPPDDAGAGVRGGAAGPPLAAARLRGRLPLRRAHPRGRVGAGAQARRRCAAPLRGRSVQRAEPLRGGAGALRDRGADDDRRRRVAQAGRGPAAVVRAHHGRGGDVRPAGRDAAGGLAAGRQCPRRGPGGDDHLAGQTGLTGRGGVVLGHPRRGPRRGRGRARGAGRLAPRHRARPIRPGDLARGRRRVLGLLPVRRRGGGVHRGAPDPR